MIKKIALGAFLLVLFVVPVIGILSRKAPDFLREALGRSLGKEVRIKEILYHFPSSFEIEGFEIREKGKFAGETSFSAGHMSLQLSPRSLLRKSLVIYSIEVRDAQVKVWKTGGRLVHALSEATKAAEAPAGAGAPAGAPAGDRPFPLLIRQFRLVDGRILLADYDVDPNGFVFAFEGIHVDVRDIALPIGSAPTAYKARATLAQGRDQKGAEFELSGRTRFDTMDTEAIAGLTGLYLPYFRPYYAQVTRAEISSGTLDSRVKLSVVSRDLTADADLTAAGLLFGAYESGDRLFGLNANEILAFLQDSGRLRLQFTVKWNLADRTVRPRELIRKSIERSLKATVLGNVGNIMRFALKKYGEREAEKPGAPASKDKLEDAINKVKQYFDSR
ncbi:MAG TPA: DUF748 domain-containing protein [Candidatus Eisenbacteria bacterium]|jgi:hypothetical protein|nr:DUF748 domain-containing protein [Candidatus Eisenbacteria bacterium]